MTGGCACERAGPGSSNVNARQRGMKSSETFGESRRRFVQGIVELATVGVLRKRIRFAPGEKGTIRHHASPEQRHVNRIKRLVRLETERSELIRGERRGLKRHGHHA